MKGYKIAGFKNGQAYSLMDKSIIPLKKGTIHSMKGGMYLGYPKQFVVDYYADMTDDQDIVLEYEFSMIDVIDGDPTKSKEGEVVVSKAKLTGFEILDDQGLNERFYSQHMAPPDVRDVYLRDAYNHEELVDLAGKMEPWFEGDDPYLAKRVHAGEEGVPTTTENDYSIAYLTENETMPDERVLGVGFYILEHNAAFGAGEDFNPMMPTNEDAVGRVVAGPFGIYSEAVKYLENMMEWWDEEHMRGQSFVNVDEADDRDRLERMAAEGDPEAMAQLGRSQLRTGEETERFDLKIKSPTQRSSSTYAYDVLRDVLGFSMKQSFDLMAKLKEGDDVVVPLGVSRAEAERVKDQLLRGKGNANFNAVLVPQLMKETILDKLADKIVNKAFGGDEEGEPEDYEPKDPTSLANLSEAEVEDDASILLRKLHAWNNQKTSQRLPKRFVPMQARYASTLGFTPDTIKSLADSGLVTIQQNRLILTPEGEQRVMQSIQSLQEKMTLRILPWQDKMPGGLADEKTPDDFDQKELTMGLKVELEHTNDWMTAMEIAMDHLTEDPQYYTNLFQAGIAEAIKDLAEKRKKKRKQGWGGGYWSVQPMLDGGGDGGGGGE
jgi:hypothetical protein